MNKQKGSVAVWIVIVLIVVIGVGVVYWSWSQGSAQQTTSTSTAAEISTTQQTQTQPTQTAAQPKSSSSSALSATPTSGSSPLTVTFSTSDTTIGGAPTGYDIEFGDGSFGSLVCDPSTSNCTPMNIQHTYATTGTYSATLNTFDTPDCPYSGSPIGCPTKNTGVIATVTVTVH